MYHIDSLFPLNYTHFRWSERRLYIHEERRGTRDACKHTYVTLPDRTIYTCGSHEVLYSYIDLWGDLTRVIMHLTPPFLIYVEEIGELKEDKAMY